VNSQLKCILVAVDAESYEFSIGIINSYISAAAQLVMQINLGSARAHANLNLNLIADHLMFLRMVKNCMGTLHVDIHFNLKAIRNYYRKAFYIYNQQ